MGQADGHPDEAAHCFYCFETFVRKAIEEYDELLGDAFCPFCGIDSVVFGNRTQEEIRKLAEKAWAVYKPPTAAIPPATAGPLAGKPTC